MPKARSIAIVCIALAATVAAEPRLTLSVGDHRPPVDFRLLREPEAPPINDWDQLAGQVVVLDLWATWCAPCVAAFPHLNELAATFRDRPVRFFSVTYERANPIRTFLAEHPLTTEVGLDVDFATFKSLKGWGIPMAVLFDRDGTVGAVIHPEHLTTEVIETLLRDEVPDVPQHPGWPDPSGAEEYFRSLRDGA